MMSQDFNDPDDRHLRNLLRQVELPEGLARRLKAIPDWVDDPYHGLAPVALAPSAGNDPASSRRPFTGRWGWVVAGSLAASLLLVWLGSQWWSLAASPRTPVAQHGDQEVFPHQVPDADGAEAARLASGVAGIERLEALVAGLELARLEHKRDQLTRSFRTPARPLDRREAAALALVTGCESVEDFGLSGRLVEAELTRVIELLPGTAGSKRAESLLESMSRDNAPYPST